MAKKDDIKSVFVEVIKKDELVSFTLADKIQRGPFAGIFTRKIDGSDDLEQYVILYTESDDVKTPKKILDIFNLEYYNIVMIEIRKEHCVDYVNLRNTTQDQEEAFTEVAEILAHMQEFNRVEADKNLIDLGTYDTLDYGAVIGKHVNKSTYNAKKTVTGVYSAYKAPARKTTTTTTVVKKEPPEMRVIKRRRGCNVKMLARMFEMVPRIADGFYEAPDLPEAPKENVTIAVEKDDKADNYAHGGWYA